jgi:hypothetical protein
MTKQDELCQNLQDRVDLLDGDFRTFIWVNSDGKDIAREKGLGGGNILILMGELALLSVLVKVHAVLFKGEAAFSDPERCQVNELDAFKRFMCWTSFPLGIDKDDEALMGRLWKGMRDTLFHMATLSRNGTAVAYVFEGIPFEDAHELVGHLDAPFELLPNNRLNCYVNCLRRSLKLWLGDLKQEIQQRGENDAEEVLSWIKRVESDVIVVGDQEILES